MITITRKNGYFEASDGAWSVDGTTWFDKNSKWVSVGMTLYRTTLKSFLDSEGKEQSDPEPQTFTGDPSKWGAGLYESSNAIVATFECGHVLWYGKNTGVLEPVWGVEVSEDFTRISDDPADILGAKGVG